MLVRMLALCTPHRSVPDVEALLALLEGCQTPDILLLPRNSENFTQQS
jgi:hypothetical protein